MAERNLIMDTSEQKHGNAEVKSKKRKIKSFMVLGSRFDVDARYMILDGIGQGAYGVVCAAKDELTDELIAIKKIQNAFEHTTYTKRTLREIRILRLLNHDNIIKIKTILRPIRPNDFSDIYVIFELMETDLSSIIKSPQPLSFEHVQFFCFQLLKGVKALHVANIIHRDLKPRNLLVNSNCDLRICDFGLARIDFPEHSWKSVEMTDYVATRWYRAPEILMSLRRYGKAVDIWSVGCILGELATRKPLFPGSDSNNQLQLILGLCGAPSARLMSKIGSDNARTIVTQYLQQSSSQTVEDSFPEIEDDECRLKISQIYSKLRHRLSHFSRQQVIQIFILLIEMLDLDPSQRIDVHGSIEDSFFSHLYRSADQPPAQVIPRELFEFEKLSLTRDQLRNEILAEINVHNTNSEDKQVGPDSPIPTAANGNKEGTDWDFSNDHSHEAKSSNLSETVFGGHEKDADDESKIGGAKEVPKNRNDGLSRANSFNSNKPARFLQRTLSWFKKDSK